MDFISQDDRESGGYQRGVTLAVQSEPCEQMAIVASSQPQAASEGRRVGHGAKSDAVREQAILALLCERSIRAAAERCGVGERTLRTWLNEDAAFQADYDAARQATFEAGLRRVKTLTEEAAATLAELLGGTQPPAVRLGAARTVMEFAVQQHEAEERAGEVRKIPHKVTFIINKAPNSDCAP